MKPKHIRICPNCGRKFKPKYDGNKYCSPFCCENVDRIRGFVTEFNNRSARFLAIATTARSTLETSLDESQEQS